MRLFDCQWLKGRGRLFALGAILFLAAILADAGSSTDYQLEFDRVGQGGGPSDGAGIVSVEDYLSALPEAATARSSDYVVTSVLCIGGISAASPGAWALYR
jgi:hypothetical protein